MDIHLSQIELEKQFFQDELDLEKASMVATELSRIERFAANAAPTKHNFGVIEELVSNFNRRFGTDLITLNAGELYKTMANLDEEGLRETGQRIYRAIARVINRIISFFRNLWRMMFVKDEKNAQKIKDKFELLEEQITSMKTMYKDLELSHGDSFSKTSEVAKQIEEIKGVVFLSPKEDKIVDPDHFMDDLFSSVNRKGLMSLPALDFAEDGVVSNIAVAVKDRVESARKIASLGPDTSLISLSSALMSVTSEDTLVGLFTKVEEHNKSYGRDTQLKEPSKNGFPVGFFNVKIRKDATGGVNSLSVVKPAMARSKSPSRIQGSFSYNDLKATEEARNSIIEVRKALQLVVDEYLKTLQQIGGDNGTSLREAVARINSIKLPDFMQPRKQEAEKLCQNFHNVIKKESKLFEETLKELDTMDKHLVDFIEAMQNPTTFPGRPEK